MAPDWIFYAVLLSLDGASGKPGCGTSGEFEEYHEFVLKTQDIRCKTSVKVQATCCCYGAVSKEVSELGGRWSLAARSQWSLILQD
jgi:hypothetical protein